MAYAVSGDITDRYGAAELLLVSDRDGDGVIDTGVVDAALTDATAEIDVYIGVKYDLPLAEVPAVVVRLCVDIAMYRMAVNAGIETDQRRLRHDDSVSLLRDLSTGAASLGIASPPSSITHIAVRSGGSRNFSRTKLKDVF